MSTPDLTIHHAFLPHHDHEASLAFYRDTLGFEVRNDVEWNGLHWLTVGPRRPARDVDRAVPARGPARDDGGGAAHGEPR